jgi:hypothetical protein
VSFPALSRHVPYKGFHVALFVPEVIELGKPNGRVQISARNEDMGIRVTPDCPPQRGSRQRTGFSYATWIIDFELASGFGIDLRNE